MHIDTADEESCSASNITFDAALTKPCCASWWNEWQTELHSDKGELGVYPKALRAVASLVIDETCGLYGSNPNVGSLELYTCSQNLNRQLGFSYFNLAVVLVRSSGPSAAL